MPSISLRFLIGILLLSFLACKNEAKPNTNSPEVKLKKMMKAIKDLHIMQGVSPYTKMNEASLDSKLRELNEIRKNIQTQYLVLQNRATNKDDLKMIELLFNEDQRIEKEYKNIEGKDFNKAIPMLDLLIAQSKALSTAMKEYKTKYTPNS